MKTNCGVDFEKKLAKKAPWARFDYLRLWLIKKLKNETKEHKHLEIANLRRTVKMTAKHITALKLGLVDYDSYVALAREINEKYEMLVFGYEDKITGQPKVADTDVGFKETKPKRPSTKRVKTKLGIDLEFINHHCENLGLIIDGNKIHVYENNFESKNADVVLIGRATVFIKGKEKERTFPQIIKI